MLRRSIGIVLCTAALLGVAMPAGADVVLDWNGVLLNAIRVDKMSPPKASRAMAIVHVAIFDAVNGILGGYTPFHVVASAPAGASPEAAAAAAAHTALVALFPSQQATFDAALNASLSAIPDGSAKTAGISWGASVAEQILALRSSDHSADAVAYGAPLGGGWWTPTPPAFAAALLPNWPIVTPWCMTKGSQFRQDAPPFPTSKEYTAAFREVLRLGRKDSTERTADQTQIALFWADGAGTETPPGHWLQIAQEIAERNDLPLDHHARLFALLSLSLADAAIVSWDHKYAFSNWRPVTGIQHADQDGNPRTTADPRWEPLIATPPFPSYSSGHSTFSGAASRMLALFFDTDEVSFSTTSDGLPGVTRSFTTFSQAAEEAGQSRIYGGIHWQFDNKAGLSSGRTLAEHVFYGFLEPVLPPSTCIPGSTQLCLNGGRFEVKAFWYPEPPPFAHQAHVLPSTGDSGQFYFFHPDNTELTVKVLNGCGVNGRYWVFASGLTNIEVVLIVTDTQTGRIRRYFNPKDKPFAPVQDVSAFATCP
ncbi:MAG TPA: vanadium-dependent haloperoxidase [Thermoanaerobaculia bacterium]|jgi:membrane-associated phospholipid phosphatase|nr:vanadium-dependent haloperoxidase [Thermoanaerobaculia bacterium]